MPRKQIRCSERGCLNVFQRRFAGQKAGTCMACRRERCRLAGLHEKRKPLPLPLDEFNARIEMYAARAAARQPLFA